MDIANVITGPGKLVYALFFGRGDRFVAEAAQQMAPVLGVVFWLVVVLVFSLVLRPRRARAVAASHTAATSDTDRAPRGFAGAFSSIVRSSEKLTPELLIGAAWRAEVVHIALYFVVPLLWEAARYMLILAFLPFFLIGFGDKTIGATDGTLNHLAQPSCWTFVTFCGGPRSNFLHDKVQDLSGCIDGKCAPPSSILVDYQGWGWKALWLVFSALWIGPWWWLRRRRVSGSAAVLK